MASSDPIAELTGLLKRLPGIGEKTAQRLALYLVTADAPYARSLGEAIRTLHDRVRPCDRCGNLATEPSCAICADARREHATVCVVGTVADLRAIERTGGYRGVYHVLGGLLSPLDGIGPSEIRADSLLRRTAEAAASGEPVREVILATPPTVEGEATALYLAQALKSSGARVTRIAQGIPHGGEIEYADAVTLGRALDSRKEVS